MTSQGSPYHRFRHALDRGNTLQALSAATELQQVGLADALELLILLGRSDDHARFRRGVVRWHARYCRETAELEPAEAQAVLGLLIMLGRPRRAQAAHALFRLLDRSATRQAGEALLRSVEADG